MDNRSSTLNLFALGLIIVMLISVLWRPLFSVDLHNIAPVNTSVEMSLI